MQQPGAERPRFEKKELALSASPYVFLPMDIPVYAVEVTHKDPVDGELLQKALDRTIVRMPYLSDTYEIEGCAIYYAKNPLPMEVAHSSSLRRVGGRETNWHMLDVTWHDNVTNFAMYHGFCDGQGIYTFLESVLCHYYCMKDGVEYEVAGIRTDRDEMSAAEEFEPLSVVYEVDPGFEMPARDNGQAPYHLPEFGADVVETVRDYGFAIPSEALMGFVKENASSPAVVISMLVGEAIERVHPDADAPIVALVPISIRRMLGCEDTFKNCSSRAMLKIVGSELDGLPFAERAAKLRGALKQQMDPNRHHAIQNMLGQAARARMGKQDVGYWDEIKNPSSFMGAIHDTFYTDYIGSLHETPYSEQIEGVRFLCAPARRSTLHLNVIEHNGSFLIDCLACANVDALVDALAEVIGEHGLPFERVPERSFTLPLTAWRDGLEPRV